jgi:hypothetical protein
MSYQVHDLGINTLAAQVACPIQGVETALYQFGGVADVMQPGRRHEIIRQRQLFGHPPGAASHRPDMLPATRQRFRQHRPGKLGRLIDIHHDSTVPGLVHSAVRLRPAAHRKPEESNEVGLSCYVAKLSRDSYQGGACGAAGRRQRRLSLLGRPARRTPGHTGRGPQTKIAFTAHRPVARSPPSSAQECPTHGDRVNGAPCGHVARDRLRRPLTPAVTRTGSSPVEEGRRRVDRVQQLARLASPSE